MLMDKNEKCWRELAKSFEEKAPAVFKAQARSLLELEKGVEAVHAIGKAWMRRACAEGSLPMARLLLEAGAPEPSPETLFELLDKLRRQGGKTAPGRRLTWVEMLGPAFDWASAFVDPNSCEPGRSRGARGASLLMKAGDGPRARRLLDLGADPWPRDESGRDALEHAMLSGERGWIEAVAGSGVDILDAIGWARGRGLSKPADWALAAARATIEKVCEPASPERAPVRRL